MSRVFHICGDEAVAFDLCNGGKVRAHAAAGSLEPVAGNAPLGTKKLLTVIRRASGKRKKEDSSAAEEP